MGQYKKVKIHSQLWMAENLNVDTYRNGELILHADTLEKWERYGKEKKGCWCYYDNNEVNGRKFGKLYNWYAVNDPRGIAPVGYKVPGNQDWEMLIDKLGGEDDLVAIMQSKDGFAALMGGQCGNSFFQIAETCFFWSSTDEARDYGCALQLHIEYGTMFYHDGELVDKWYGYSVRCIGNEEEKEQE